VFAGLMKDLQAVYDVLIIDSPPARHYADAQSITFRAGDALVVARKNHTAVASTQKTIRELAATGARVVGTVVNDC
jgi:protein-tyrosine kinase